MSRLETGSHAGEHVSNKPRRALKYAAGVAAIFLFGGGLITAQQWFDQNSQESFPSSNPVTVTPTLNPESATPSVENTPSAAETPEKIGLSREEAEKLTKGAPIGFEWSAMGISTTQIEKVGLEDNGSLAAPKGYKNVGWYAGGEQACNSTGALIMDFHMSRKDGVTLVGPDFAQKVAEMGVGSIISIPIDGGLVCNYQVTQQATVDKWDEQSGFPALAKKWDIWGKNKGAGPTKLTVITCAGGWNNRENTSQEATVIVAVLVGQESR